MELCDSNVSLPPNWIKKGSKSHPDKFYYHNIVTKKSVWKLSELPMQKTNNDKSKVITPNKQLTSISHGSKAIKRNIAEDRLKSLKKGLSKEVANNIKNDHKILTQNTSERPRSIKKHNTKSSLPRHSFSPMSVARKNLAQQRMKNLTSSFSFESKQLESTSSIKRKLDMSPNIDIFSAKRLTTSSVNPDMFTPNRSVTLKTSNNGSFTSSRSLTSHNFNDSFTPKRSLTKNKDTDNSARKILKSSRKSSTVQDRLIINNDVFMLDVSSDITTEEMDDKMDWEEIPVQKIVEKVQNVRNNPNISLMSSNDQVRKSHRNVNHSEDHFYCVIDTNVLLSNLDTIKNMEGTIYHSKSKHNILLYIFLN